MNSIQVNDLFFKYNSDDSFSIDIEQLEINQQTQLFLEGPSGCGKTTFLNLLTGLLKPQIGTIQVLGTNINALSATEADRFRADHFGIIFQLFNLIPYLSVIENIILPCTFSKIKKEKALKQSRSLELEASRICKELDIHSEYFQKSVHDLSIGQQQRVAIARALIGQPDIIIADEPTSALDNISKEQFMNILLSECKKINATLIFVSHDTTLKSQFPHSYQLNQLTEMAHVTI